MPRPIFGIEYNDDETLPVFAGEAARYALKRVLWRVNRSLYWRVSDGSPPELEAGLEARGLNLTEAVGDQGGEASAPELTDRSPVAEQAVRDGKPPLVGPRQQHANQIPVGELAGAMERDLADQPG
jgi:hypothetical protein